MALIAAGCGFEHNELLPSSLSPSGNPGTLSGLWTSMLSTSSSSCTDFKWSATHQSATMMSGAFSATCNESISVSGTAAGTLSGSTIVLQATGAAVSQGLTCAFSLSGTGYIEGDGDAIRIPYSGQTCLGPLQGEETLRRQ
jgi:hypothetical protein